MAGPARLTPTGLQPGSAETFATYVSGTPLAKTPLTGTELVPMIQGGFPVHAPPNVVGFGPPVRTILTANTNYYVTVAGSDANDGSLAHPWATLQHAYNVIAANLDIAGFNIYVNIGAGSFAGFGAKGTVGGGNIVFFGAGSASTTITAGPNDGVFNFGENIAFEITSTGTVVGVHKVTITPGATGFQVGVSIQAPDWFIWLTDQTNAAAVTDIVFNLTNSPSYCVAMEAPAVLQDGIFGPGGSIAVHGAAATISDITFLVAGAVYFQAANWAVTGGLTVSSTVNSSSQAQYIQLAGTFTGTVTGSRFAVTLGGVIGQFGGAPGALGPTFFPGSTAGTADNGSVYDGFLGSGLAYPQPTTTLRTVLTANTTFYVRTTGNDSNPGSLASPWATIQHAMDFIAANLDSAGFSITVNIGAGTFAGFGTKAFAALVSFVGAGATTIIDTGPNDGVYNFGEAICVNTVTAILVDNVKFKYAAPAVNNYIDIFVFHPSGFGFGSTGITFDLTNANVNVTAVVLIDAANALFYDLNGPVTVIGAGVSVPSVIQIASDSIYEGEAVWTVTGLLTVTAGFINIGTNSKFVQEIGSSGYVGAGVTGQRFVIATDSAAYSVLGPARLGANFFPGSSAGTVDATSNYDGFPGPLPGIDTQTGASYTLALGDVDEIVEMNNAGANTLTVPTNASVAFPIGVRIWVTQTGAGATTIAAAGGVTVNNVGAVGGQWKSVKLYKSATNTWTQTNA